MKLDNKKILIAFFSHKGENYAKGGIVNLETGNTAIVAEQIARFVTADLFEICSANGYPNDYNACVAQARDELRADARPKLASDIDISDYDIIFLGYPNWCGTMPMPVWTFLTNHNFYGKSILPFCTHGGSGMGNSETDIKSLASIAQVKKGFAVYGSDVHNSGTIIKGWLADNELLRLN